MQSGQCLPSSAIHHVSGLRSPTRICMTRILVHPTLDSPEAKEGTCDQRRLRSDCAKVQADQSSLAARLIVGFVARWLNINFKYIEVKMQDMFLLKLANFRFANLSRFFLLFKLYILYMADRCPHIPKDTFLHGEANIMSIFFFPA